MSERVRVPVLYLDIDGTVRHSKAEMGRYVDGPEDVRVFHEVPALLAGYRRAGWRIVGCSNQKGIALGSTTEERVDAAMLETQQQCGGPGIFEFISYCRHHPDSPAPELRVCWCRKPRAGLVIAAATRLEQTYPGETYPPSIGLFVGDQAEDWGCAESAALPFMLAPDWRAGRHQLEERWVAWRR